jgi:iron complex transport system substrate-binding protein
MKMKSKTLALVEIAIVLCSMFLVAIPAIATQEQNQAMKKVSATASEVTTASEDDYVLGIYGNANEDDTIDMGDVVYVKLAIFGKKPKTELCDAKYDGRINVLDVIQAKLIILGKEKEITVIDSLDRIVTVKKPVERFVVCYMKLEMIRSLKVSKDRIVGVHYTVQRDKGNIVFFPEYQDKPTVASEDPESVLKLCPDLVTVHLSSSWGRDHLQDVCEAAGIPVFRARGGSCGIGVVEEMEKFGYILDKKDEAAEFIDWYEGVENSIMEKVESIPEGDKPKVYLEYARYKTLAETHSHIAKTGGKSIFKVIKGSQAVDPEAVARLNPDIILIRGGRQDFAIGGYGIDDTTELKEAREELMSRKELEDVTAVKTGKVYVFNSYITGYMRPAGARQFILDAYQAKWFNPELFEDLDPKALHQEYLTRFQGLDIDLDEKGIFVYHPEEHPDGK